MCHLFWNSSSLLDCSISSSTDFQLPCDIPYCPSVRHCSVSVSLRVSVVQVPLVFWVFCFTWMEGSGYTGFLLSSAVVGSVVSPFEQTEMSSHSCEQMVSLPRSKDVLVILLVMYFWLFLLRQFCRLCWGFVCLFLKMLCTNSFKSIKAVELDMYLWRRYWCFLSFKFVLFLWILFNNY